MRSLRVIHRRARFAASKRLLVAALAGSVLLGCATTTIRSGQPPGVTAEGMDRRWHSAFLFGTVRGDRYELDRLCPGGWSELRVEPDPFTLLVGLLTLFVYAPSRVTVVCAGPDRPPTPAF